MSRSSRSLVRNRQQRIELLRIDAAGRDTPGNRLDAWDAYLRLADFTAEEPAYLRIDDRYTVRSDRWISSRLAALWQDATPAERKAFAEKLAARRPDLTHPLAAAEMRHYLAHVGRLPGSEEVRLALAHFLADRGRSQEAEIDLLRLFDPRNPGATPPDALKLLASLDAKMNQHFGPTHVDWPRGRVDSEFIAATSIPQIRERQSRLPAERQNGYRPLRVEQDYGPSDASIHWFIATDSSEIIGRNALGDDVYHWTVDQSNLSRQFRDSSLVHGARVGHLLFFTLGGQVMAIDSRQQSPNSDGDLLWPNNTDDDLFGDSPRPRRTLSAALPASADCLSTTSCPGGSVWPARPGWPLRRSARPPQTAWSFKIKTNSSASIRSAATHSGHAAIYRPAASCSAMRNSCLPPISAIILPTSFR